MIRLCVIRCRGLSSICRLNRSFFGALRTGIVSATQAKVLKSGNISPIQATGSWHKSWQHTLQSVPSMTCCQFLDREIHFVFCPGQSWFAEGKFFFFLLVDLVTSWCTQTWKCLCVFIQWLGNSQWPFEIYVRLDRACFLLQRRCGNLEAMF